MGKPRLRYGRRELVKLGDPLRGQKRGGVGDIAERVPRGKGIDVDSFFPLTDAVIYEIHITLNAFNHSMGTTPLELEPLIHLVLLLMSQACSAVHNRVPLGRIHRVGVSGVPQQDEVIRIITDGIPPPSVVSASLVNLRCLLLHISNILICTLECREKVLCVIPPDILGFFSVGGSVKGRASSVPSDSSIGRIG